MVHKIFGTIRNIRESKLREQRISQFMEHGIKYQDALNKMRQELGD